MPSKKVMSSKKVMLGPNSVVPHVMADSTLPIFLPKNKPLLDMLSHADAVYSASGELVLAKGCAIPNGFGRSVRAVILGLKYKSAWRINGAIDQFAHAMFALPQDSSTLQARMKPKKQTSHSRVNKQAPASYAVI